MNYYTILAPSSKSYSHRYLLASCLTKNIVKLHNILLCDDLLATKNIIQTLGVIVDSDLYNPTHSIFHDSSSTPHHCIVDAHGSATLSRFLTCLLADAPSNYTFTITGNPQLLLRSHKETDYYASLLNLHVHYHLTPHSLPYTITPCGIPLTSSFSLPHHHISSQYISGLLFALARSPIQRNLYCNPYNIPSFPYICSTIYTLQQFGFDISFNFSTDSLSPSYPIDILSCASIYKQFPLASATITINPSSCLHYEHHIPSDFSSISYLLAFGILGSKPIRILYSGADAPQADYSIIQIIRDMGGIIEDDGHTLTAYPSLDSLIAIDIDVDSCPDLFPTFAVLLAFAKGSATLNNIARIRTKESNRVHAIATGLSFLGFQIHEEDNFISIGERSSIPSQMLYLHSFDDHRIAMALSLANIVQPNTVSIDNPLCVQKSFPHYWDIYNAVLALQ